MNGHTKAINAVKFLPINSTHVSVLLSGAADNTIRIWRAPKDKASSYTCVKTVTGHANPITKIATLPGSDVFATGSSDGSVKIWKLVHDESFTSIDVDLLQTIALKPKYFPLILALGQLDAGSLVLAVAGTRPTIQIFVSRDTQFELSATLTGHEGWIRALDFTRETSDPSSDLLLASASQDKYIRLWRFHQGNELPVASSALNDPALGGLVKSLSNKAHWIESATSKHSSPSRRCCLDTKTGSTQLRGDIEKGSCSYSRRRRTTRFLSGSLIRHQASGCVSQDLERSALRKDPQVRLEVRVDSGSVFGRQMATLSCL